MLLTKILLKYKDTCVLDENICRKIYHANTNQKKVGEAILISDTADLLQRK
jgi:hypothetical protein